jgi:SAM-dependent methyltransferase
VIELIATMQTHPSSNNDLRHRYEVECELADMLRKSNAAERRSLYGHAYDELTRRAPTQPLAQRSKDPAALREFGLFQLGVLRPFLGKQSVLLEIGAGDCALSLVAAPLVKRVLAIDVSAATARIESPPANFEFKLFDGFNLPVEDNSVDIAYSRDVIEHLHPDDTFEHMQRVLRALKQGGKYVCITPNRLSGPWDVSRFFDRTPRGFHLREYTNGELKDLLLRAGFREARVFLSVGTRHLSGLIPIAPITAIERVIGALPLKLRRPVAGPLVVAKFVGVK